VLWLLGSVDWRKSKVFFFLDWIMLPECLILRVHT